MSAFIWDGFSRKQHASTFAPGGGFVLFTPLQLLRHLRWAAPSLAFQARPWEVDPSGASEEEEVQVPSEMPDPKKQLASPWPPHLYVGGRWAPRVSKGRNPPLALWQELAFYENGGRKLSQGEPVLPKAPSSLSGTAHLRWQRSRLPSLGFGGDTHLGWRELTHPLPNLPIPDASCFLDKIKSDYILYRFENKVWYLPLFSTEFAYCCLPRYLFCLKINLLTCVVLTVCSDSYNRIYCHSQVPAWRLSFGCFPWRWEGNLPAREGKSFQPRLRL